MLRSRQFVVLGGLVMLVYALKGFSCQSTSKIS
jgi:hypothetical protein